MPFIPAVNCARVEFRMTLDTQQVENVAHFRFLAGAPTQLDLSTLVAFCLAWWVNSYSNVIVDDVVLTEVVATALNADTGPQATVSGGGATGDIVAESMPGNVAFCLTKRTASIGRSARGRWYAVGLAESTVNVNNLSVVDASAFAVRVHNLFVAAPPTGWEGVVVSYQHNGLPLVTATIYPIISVIARDTIVDSQRRRLPGRGS